MPNNSSIFLTLLVSLLFGICTSLTGKALMPARHQATYEAFGTRTAEQGSNTGRQRANTKEEDPTGLLNEGQRYRDLDAGVFISRDPAGFVDGPNVYAYVRQNPWTSFDPEGLSAWSDFTGFWGGVGEHAWGAAKGVGQLAMNLDPGMNTWQSISGNKTGYQKQFEGAKQAYNGYVASAENLGANSTLQDRNSVALVLDAAANYVDVAIKDPKKAGGLAFDAVTTLATGAEAGMALYSRSAGLGAAGSKSARAVNFETVIE